MSTRRQHRVGAGPVGRQDPRASIDDSATGRSRAARGSDPSDVNRVVAAVLAGGLGSRLRPVVAAAPKVLADVAGRPFLAYLLDGLISAGVRRVVLCTGYLGEQVSRAFGPTYGPLALRYSHEDMPLGTGGAIRLALPLLESDPVLVLNGDSYCDADLADFIAWHRKRGATATVVAVEAGDAGRYGRLVLDDKGNLISFQEKITGGGPGLVNAGIYILSRRVVEAIPARAPISLERDVLPTWIGHGLVAYCHQGQFIDIGTPDSYRLAQALWAAGGACEGQPT